MRKSEGTDPLIDEYLDSIWLERGLSEHTLAAYRRDLRYLATALGCKNKVKSRSGVKP